MHLKLMSHPSSLALADEDSMKATSLLSMYTPSCWQTDDETQKQLMETVTSGLARLGTDEGRYYGSFVAVSSQTDSNKAACEGKLTSEGEGESSVKVAATILNQVSKTCEHESSASRSVADVREEEEKDVGSGDMTCSLSLYCRQSCPENPQADLDSRRKVPPKDRTLCRFISGTGSPSRGKGEDGKGVTGGGCRPVSVPRNSLHTKDGTQGVEGVLSVTDPPDIHLLPQQRTGSEKASVKQNSPSQGVRWPVSVTDYAHTSPHSRQNRNYSLQGGPVPRDQTRRKPIVRPVPVLSKRSVRGWTFLHRACLRGDERAVRALIEQGADILTSTTTTTTSTTPLFVACRQGHARIATLLLQHGARADGADSQGVTPLLAAIHGGREDVVELLLQHGAAVDRADPETGCTPLFLASRQDHDSLVRLLLQRGARVNTRISTGETPLHVCPRLSTVRLLLLHGADPEALDDERCSPLFPAASRGDVNVLQALLACGVRADGRQAQGGTALMVACHAGHVRAADFLLRHGARLEDRDGSGETALHKACRQGHGDVVSFLLGYGAHVKAKSRYGLRPLHLACLYGHEEVAERLLDGGAAVDDVSEQGYTALHLACACSHHSLALLLLKRGAKMKAVDKEGWSALHHCARNGDVAMAQTLLKHGDKLNQDYSRKTYPLHLACGFGHVEFVKLLLEHEACVSSMDSEGWTPLHSACLHGHLEVVHELHLKGAQDYFCDDSGMTPLHLAAYQGHAEVVQALLDHGANTTNETSEGDTALSLALSQGHTHVVEVITNQQPPSGQGTNSNQQDDWGVTDWAAQDWGNDDEVEEDWGNNVGTEEDWGNND